MQKIERLIAKNTTSKKESEENCKCSQNRNQIPQKETAKPFQLCICFFFFLQTSSLRLKKNSSEIKFTLTTSAVEQHQWQK